MMWTMNLMPDSASRSTALAWFVRWFQANVLDPCQAPRDSHITYIYLEQAPLITMLSDTMGQQKRSGEQMSTSSSSGPTQWWLALCSRGQSISHTKCWPPCPGKYKTWSADLPSVHTGLAGTWGAEQQCGHCWWAQPGLCTVNNLWEESSRSPWSPPVIRCQSTFCQQWPHSSSHSLSWCPLHYRTY